MNKFGMKVSKENEALAIAIKEGEKRLKALKAEALDNFAKMREMRGKYAVSEVRSDRIDMRYDCSEYVYASEEDKAREETEIEAFRKEKVEALHIEIDELERKLIDMNNELCIALHGYGVEEYERIQLKKRYAKAIEEHEREIARLKKEMEKI